MDKTKKNIIELTRIAIDDYKATPKIKLKIVVDNVRSLNNIGSIFRTSDAFLVDEIILCGISGTPPNPDIHKTALGAEESVKWSYNKSTLDAVKCLKETGFTICSLEQAHNSVSLNDFVPADEYRYALVVGNEVNGVEQSVVDISDFVIEIPQCGTKHSLNVAVSTGIAIWHFFNALTGQAR